MCIIMFGLSKDQGLPKSLQALVLLCTIQLSMRVRLLLPDTTAITLEPG
jgi:hypothetical protein